MHPPLPPPPAHRAPPRPRATSEAPRVGDFSPAARRRLATLLRLRLLELREARLDRVRAVVERRLPVDALFGDPP